MIANSDGSGRDHSAIDAAMMERCIRLAEDAIMKLLWQQQIRWYKTQTSRATRSSSHYRKRKKRSEPKTSPRARSIRSWSLARCVLLQFAKLELVASYSPSSRR